MTSAMTLDARHDRTHLPHVLRAGTILGAVQTLLIILFAFLQPRLSGPIELIVLGPIFVVGVAATIVLPGRWTEARTIEGIAGAAGLGLWATVIFLVVDSIAQTFLPGGLFTNRWREIGGGSNWWYHPVWWMVCTYLAGLGAWVRANQAARHGEPSPAALVVGTLVLSAVVMTLAAILGFPGARFGLGTFAVSILPGLALMTVISGLGVPRH